MKALIATFFISFASTAAFAYAQGSTSWNAIAWGVGWAMLSVSVHRLGNFVVPRM